MTKKFLVVIIASPVTKDVNYYMNFKTVVSVYLYDIMAIFSFPMLVTLIIVVIIVVKKTGVTCKKSYKRSNKKGCVVYIITGQIAAGRRKALLFWF